jgi:hypothetical protein
MRMITIAMTLAHSFPVPSALLSPMGDVAEVQRSAADLQ